MKELVVEEFGNVILWLISSTIRFNTEFSSVQLSSVVQLCLTLCDPVNCSTPGLPVHHKLPEFTQTHVRWVSDAIQLSQPLSSYSPPVPNPSQHQGLFQWVNSSQEVAKVLEFQLQHQSFQWTPRTDLLQDGLVGSPCSPRGSQESSPTPQFTLLSHSGNKTGLCFLLFCFLEPRAELESSLRNHLWPLRFTLEKTRPQGRRVG